MDTELTAFEAIEIAERIECNGAKFYRQAAGLCRDPGMASLFLELARWEEEHLKIFGRMKQQYAGRRAGGDHVENGPDAPMKATALAGLAVFGMQPDPSQELNGRESRTEVLKRAVEKEKDSIVFYSGLKDFLTDRQDGAVLDDIIAEEKKHMRLLTESLEASG